MTIMQTSWSVARGLSRRRRGPARFGRRSFDEGARLARGRQIVGSGQHLGRQPALVADGRQCVEDGPVVDVAQARGPAVAVDEGGSSPDGPRPRGSRPRSTSPRCSCGRDRAGCPRCRGPPFEEFERRHRCVLERGLVAVDRLDHERDAARRRESAQSRRPSTIQPRSARPSPVGRAPRTRPTMTSAPNGAANSTIARTRATAVRRTSASGDEKLRPSSRNTRPVPNADSRSPSVANRSANHPDRPRPPSAG